MKSFVAISAFLICCSVVAEAKTLILKSEAFSLKTGKLVYREEIEATNNEQGLNTLLKTKYSDADGKVFAEMTSDFTKDAFAPDSTFTDTRFDVTEVATLDPKSRVMTIERTRKGKKKVVKLTPGGDFISGQGFNNYVIKNFEAMSSGQKMKVRFIVLDQQDEFGFDVFAAKGATDSLIPFTIQLGNWALRQVVGPITVTYSKDARQLKRFEGLSNLLNEKEGGWPVRIEYGDAVPKP